jgi:hypothetical protein
MHFTPTSGSWLNLVIITRQSIRRGSFDSVKELTTAIRAFIAGWNNRAHAFVWTKKTDEILPQTPVNGNQTRDSRGVATQLVKVSLRSKFEFLHGRWASSPSGRTRPVEKCSYGECAATTDLCGRQPVDCMADHLRANSFEPSLAVK